MSMAISGSDLLEVPTMYKVYFSGLCKGISLQNMARNMVQYLNFRYLNGPLTMMDVKKNGDKMWAKIWGNDMN